MTEKDDPERPSRRRLLALGAAGLAGLAGCSSGSDPTNTTTSTTAATTTAAETTATTTEATETTTETTEETTEETTTEEPPEFTVPEGGAHFDVEDGFASIGEWVEMAAVHKVTEPTREALDEAVNGPGKRIVVFETSGTIDLGEERFTVEYDNTWIAGQTAPSPGITLTRGGFWIEANDCVVQHLRVRPGDAGNTSGWEPDTIRTADGTENNVVDHCTATWSVDENVSPGYNSARTTFSNCLVAEPLDEASHHKGSHCYNMLVGNGATEVAILGNVFANSYSRNPRLKAETESAVVNNLMYHFDEAAILDDSTVSSIVGNAFWRVDVGDANVEGGQGYLADNVTDPDTPMSADFEEQERTIWPEGLEAMAGADAGGAALTYAGARPADRSEHDRRVVENVRTGGGSTIDSQEEVGGYPELPENTREVTDPGSDYRDWLAAWAVAVEEEDVEPPAEN